MVKELSATLAELSGTITFSGLEGVVHTDAAETADLTIPCLITDFDVKAAGQQAALQFHKIYTATVRWTLVVSAHDVSREDFLTAANVLEEQTARFCPKEANTAAAFSGNGLRLITPFVLTDARFMPGTDTTAESLTFSVEQEFTFAG